MKNRATQLDYLEDKQNTLLQREHAFKGLPNFSMAIIIILRKYSDQWFSSHCSQKCQSVIVVFNIYTK